MLNNLIPEIFELLIHWPTFALNVIRGLVGLSIGFVIRNRNGFCAHVPYHTVCRIRLVDLSILWIRSVIKVIK